MNRTFVIADPHFGDPNIIKYENRPFKDVEEMDKWLIDSWNHIVGDDSDTVFVLGDFSAYNFHKTRDIVEQLNGVKNLIKGNHDNMTTRQYVDMGFMSAVEYPIIYNNFFILSHEPVYINANMPYANIYGHVHSNPTFRDFSERSACVCVERTEYRPMAISDIISRMKQTKSKDDSPETDRKE